MGKLVLLRHGESVFNRLNLFTGFLNIGLSKKGIEEAVSAGEQLADICFDAVFVSKLIRTQLTAAIVMANNKKSKTAIFPEEATWGADFGSNDFLHVIESEALNERHYGKLQGKNKDQVKEEFGQQQFMLWRRSYDIPPPEGESLKMTIERTLPFCQKEIFPRVERGETVLVCAHGNSIRGIVKHLDNLSEEAIVKLEIATGIPLFYDLPR